LIERLLDRPLPPGVAALLDNDPLAKKQIAAVDARLLRTGRYEITRSAHWRTEFARAMPKSSDRWRSFYSTLFRPSVLEWMAVPLPEVLSPLYAVIRPCRLLWTRLRSKAFSPPSALIHQSTPLRGEGGRRPDEGPKQAPPAPT
jgi:hypothetical protein